MPSITATLRAHLRSLSTASLPSHVKDASPNDDTHTTDIRSAWQHLYTSHFHPSPAPSLSSAAPPSAVPIPRFYFGPACPPSPSSSSAPTSPSPSSVTSAFHSAALHLHLTHLSATLLDDSDLTSLYLALHPPHPPFAPQSPRSPSPSSPSPPSPLPSTSLSFSSSLLCPSPLLFPLDAPLTYPIYASLLPLLPPPKRALLSPLLYASLPSPPPSPTSPPSCPTPRTLLLSLLYLTHLTPLHLALLSYSSTPPHTHLTEEDLTHLIADHLSQPPTLTSPPIDPTFLPYYVFSVVRKVWFFHARGKARVSVQQLSHSAIMHEWEWRRRGEVDPLSHPPTPTPPNPLTAQEGLAQLRTALAQASAAASAAGELIVGAPSLSSALSSCTDPGRVSATAPRPCWFSLLHAQAVYSLYLSLDRDQNGMLSRAELGLFHGGSFTSALMDALYATLPLYPSQGGQGGVEGEGGVGEEVQGELEMDYKGFLDFVLALEYPQTAPALAYFFALLDVKGVGYLDRGVLAYWFRHVRARLQELGHEGVPTCDVLCDEVLDMVSPLAVQGRITLAELQRSRCGHTVVSILTDVNGFWRYDHRETLMAQQQQQQH